MHYKVVTELRLDQLEIHVNQYLSRGWRPAGGISSQYYEEHSLNGTSNCHRYCQAIIFEGKRTILQRLSKYFGE